ncbi:MAG: hypothetical protein WEC59_01945, partial [Salibacteraceae bacterium]
MNFTIISSKTIDWSKINTYEIGHKRTMGFDKKLIIYVIPFGLADANLALDRAIEAVPGAIALVDGYLMRRFFYIPYIYGENTYIIEGTPLIDPALASSQGVVELHDFSYCILNNAGDVI